MIKNLYSIIFFCLTLTQVMAQESEELLMPDDPFLKKYAVKVESRNWIYLADNVDATLILREFSQSEGKKKLQLTAEDELITKNGVKMSTLETSGAFGGDTVVRFEQWHGGVFVEGAQLMLDVNVNGKAKLLHGKLAKRLPSSEKTNITGKAALDIALEAVGAAKYAWEDPEWEQQRKLDSGDENATYLPKPEVLYARLNHGGSFKAANYALSYRFEITSLLPKYDQLEVVIDAKSGNVLRKRSLLHTASGTLTTLYNGVRSFTTEYRSFPNYDFVLKDDTRGEKLHTLKWDMAGAWWTLSEVDDKDNNWNGSLEANTHWAVQKAWDYFKSSHIRNGMDNIGGKIRIGTAYQGENAFSFRDGGYDYLVFGRTNIGAHHLSTLDVVGHEYAHGVNRHTAGLQYIGESGALDESFSDIFGVMVERFIEGATNWTIGEDANLAMRSLQNPNVPPMGGRGSADTYGGNFWINPASSDDNGGVHFNSGVQNHWFYLLSNGGSGVNDKGSSFSVQGIGVVNAAKIAYRNLTRYLGTSSTYVDARQGAINAAIDLFGECSTQHVATVNAWHAVGVGNAYANFCVSNMKATATGFCMEYNSYAATFSLDVFPANAVVSWVVPSNWTYSLANSGKTLQLTNISNPYPGTFTISARVTSGGQVITRSQLIKIESCFGSGCEPLTQLNSDATGSLEPDAYIVPAEPCMLEAATYVETNIDNESHQALTSSLLKQALRKKESEIQQDGTTGKLIVYPNPANDKVMLKAPDLVTADGFRVKVVNVLGQTLIDKQLPSNHIIEINHLSSGTYIIYLENKEIHYTTRLIILR